METIEVKEDIKYWIFEGNNRYAKDRYTKEEAIKYFKTLVNCKDCIDCENCVNCTGCYRSFRLIACIDCTACYDCIGCENSSCSNNLIETNNYYLNSERDYY